MLYYPDKIGYSPPKNKAAEAQTRMWYFFPQRGWQTTSQTTSPRRTTAAYFSSCGPTPHQPSVEGWRLVAWSGTDSKVCGGSLVPRGGPARTECANDSLLSIPTIRSGGLSVPSPAIARSNRPRQLSGSGFPLLSLAGTIPPGEEALHRTTYSHT
ncbi:hypothetical protein SAMN04488109_2107 [Chryseolinea serpens]|uniref:Uncharacterized protein n=1 Tax=Chryseolinea serpens TaxID=947013 RepID=A0A1M5N6D5_9BACT|nr:hypothetical protein SAMN04488109_2107 [Chryseolinea serpens]